MCILALALGQHPDFSFICIHNREEELGRETQDPEDDASITAAIDMRAGGTWMGLNRETGSFVALTNDRRRAYPAPSSPTSRGQLLNDLLMLYGPESTAQLGELPDNEWDMGGGGREFAGFNMLHANLFELDVDAGVDAGVDDCDSGEEAVCCQHPRVFFISNRPHRHLPGGGEADGARETHHSAGRYAHSRALVEQLPAGVYVFSNGEFEDARWPKIRRLHSRLEEVVASLPSSKTCAPGKFHEEQIVDAFVRAVEPLMCDDQPVCREDIEAFVDEMPPPRRAEELLQRVFVPPTGNGASVGTRQQTIVVRGSETVYYMYRNTDGYPDKMLPFRRFRIPILPRTGRHEWPHHDRHHLPHVQLPLPRHCSHTDSVSGDGDRSVDDTRKDASSTVDEDGVSEYGFRHLHPPRSKAQVAQAKHAFTLGTLLAGALLVASRVWFSPDKTR